jgi:hypothetical protein
MTAKMKGPEGHGGFSHDGVAYTPDEQGLIAVPHEAIEAAFCHGFTLVPEHAEGSDAGSASNKTAKPLNKMSKAELVAHAMAEHQLELVPDNMTVKEIISAIEAAAAQAAAA